MSREYDQATLQRLQKLELDILKDFIYVCDKYDLTWFSFAGTAIGALRHGGFIPWDDDIDVWMPREDYNRLIESFNTAVKVPYYRLIAPMDVISRHSFVKIIEFPRSAKFFPEFLPRPLKP